MSDLLLAAAVALGLAALMCLFIAGVAADNGYGRNALAAAAACIVLTFLAVLAGASA